MPLIDLSQLLDYWYTPKVQVYLPGITDRGSNCHCELELEITRIKEPDPTVELEGRWFIDYDVNNNVGPFFTQTFQGSSTGTNDFRGPATWAFNPDGLKLAEGTHGVEFVIAERQGFALDPTVRPHHRALNAGWDATVLKIIVEVLPTPGSLQCDQNPGVIKPLTQRICPP